MTSYMSIEPGKGALLLLILILKIQQDMPYFQPFLQQALSL